MQKTDSIEITYPAVSGLTGTGWPVVAASVVGLFFHFGSLLVAAALILRLRLAPTFKE